MLFILFIIISCHDKNPLPNSDFYQNSNYLIPKYPPVIPLNQNKLNFAQDKITWWPYDSCTAMLDLISVNLVFLWTW